MAPSVTDTVTDVSAEPEEAEAEALEHETSAKEGASEP